MLTMTLINMMPMMIDDSLEGDDDDDDDDLQSDQLTFLIYIWAIQGLIRYSPLKWTTLSTYFPSLSLNEPQFLSISHITAFNHSHPNANLFSQ